jgi:hypothetical protein
LSNQFGEDYGSVVSFINTLTEERVQAVKAFERGK